MACLVAAGILGGCSYSRPKLYKAPVLSARKAPTPREAPPVAVTVPPAQAAVPAPKATPPAPPAPPFAAAPTTAAAPAPAPVAAASELPAVIYYESDVYEIAPQYRAMLQAHAARLKADPSLRLRVEAHADPEGGTDYNRALTEMRARTVVKVLRDFGVDPGQVEIRAFGASEDDDRASWGQHRRVELVYR
jgi:peptidoglycan-associated lipoprotein